MKPWAVLLYLCLAAGPAAGKTAPPSAWAVTCALPQREVNILLGVGKEYRLTGDALKLLMTIRRIENGRPGLEMGIASNYPRHRARRYAQQPALSLRVQARWAAGTIQRRYTGDLDAFAQAYCPPQWQH